MDRSTFQAELDALRVREKTHTREDDAVAAVRRRLAMVEVDPTITVIGARGPVTLLDIFEGSRLLITYYSCGTPADQPHAVRRLHVRGKAGAELAYLHSRNITFAVFWQGPYDESARYRAPAR